MRWSVGELMDYALVPVALGLGCTLWLRSELWRRSPAELGRGIRQSLRRDSEGYAALMASLGATVGTANVVGAAGAVLLGGPGALFWIWVCGLGGMAIKYWEASLAVRYREADGVGGALTLLPLAFPQGGRALKFVYALGGLFSGIAVGAGWQSAAAGELWRRLAAHPPPPMLVGLLYALLLLPVLLGGGRLLKKVASRLVPAMCLFYALGAALVILRHLPRLPAVLAEVFASAFRPRAALGGGLGAAAAGMRCGVFSGEAGLGTAGLCYAASGERDPERAGYCGLTEVFIDTMVVCTLTALAVLTAAPPEAEGGLKAVLTAFQTVLGRLAAPCLLLTVWLFALSSSFTWSWTLGRFARALGIGRRGRALVGAAFLGAAALGARFDTQRLNVMVSLSNLWLLLPGGLCLLRLSRPPGGGEVEGAGPDPEGGRIPRQSPLFQGFPQKKD